jgi:hypothetical protein
MKTKMQKLAAAMKMRQGLWKLCKMCGTSFKAKVPKRAKFCSNRCGCRHWRIEKRWQAFKTTPQGQAYLAMSCKERAALDGLTNEQIIERGAV